MEEKEKILEQEFVFKPIGYVRHQHSELPRHWSASELEGEIVLRPEYQDGLTGLKPGDLIVVIFGFHLSPPFSLDKLIQKPPHLEEMRGVFSICSPRRPNPLGLSVLKILNIDKNIIKIKGLDMYDGTPVFDIKIYIPYREPGEK
ncbi:MAG TPA: tRNA (N6-threonylcarbamoyladenosine(37)-N6)-methyltransferase TrmO [Candidatus Aminicenantes bacterium]|nr:MAG: tRNA (N6-threonylcarbamoyladenosine(37)-N6)-methyltransferase TrmO [Candidatus Aminicenantes bacterium]HEK85917.1 tRNA (N6-threonylcarbamoyladenosine(37)-N6)-methyltransferase TrmO [Candidatus Aminicenantes bacterium]